MTPCVQSVSPVCCLVCPSVCWIFNKPPPPPPAGPVCLFFQTYCARIRKTYFCYRVGWCLVIGHWLPASCKVSYYLRARAKVQEHVKWQGQSWASLVHCRYPEIIKHCFPFRRANTEHKHWTAADDGNIPRLPAVGVVPPCLVTCCPLAAAPPLCTMTQSPPPAQDDLNCLRRAKSSAKADSWRPSDLMGLLLLATCIQTDSNYLDLVNKVVDILVVCNLSRGIKRVWQSEVDFLLTFLLNF